MHKYRAVFTDAYPTCERWITALEHMTRQGQAYYSASAGPFASLP